MNLSDKSSNVINVLKCFLCIGVVFVHGQINVGEAQLLGNVNWGGKLLIINTTLVFRRYLPICSVTMFVFPFFSYFLVFSFS